MIVPFHQCTDTSRMMMMKHHTSAPSSSSSYSSYPSSAVLQNCSSYVIHNPSTAFNASSSSALGAVNHHHHHSHHHQFQPFTTSYDVTSASSRTSTAPNTVCLSSSVRTVILSFFIINPFPLPDFLLFLTSSSRLSPLFSS